MTSKIGATISVVQHSFTGMHTWQIASTSNSHEGDPWKTHEEQIHAHGDQIAVAIGITRDIAEDAKDYVLHNLPSVTTILTVVPSNGISGMSVADGPHAVALAQALINKLTAICLGKDHKIPVHIFAAAPNAFMFILGRMAQCLSCWTLYEYDFETKAKGAYSPSLAYPPVPVPSRVESAMEIGSRKEI